jgi:hypothetical protein
MLTFYVLSFGVLYLASSDFTMDLTKEQQMRIKFYANIGKSAMETLAMIRQVFWEESMSHTRVFEWHVKTHQDGKRGDR